MEIADSKMKTTAAARCGVALLTSFCHLRQNPGYLVLRREGILVALLASLLGPSGCVGGPAGSMESHDGARSENTVASFAAEPAPEVDQPNFYDRDDIAFIYPGNWSVGADVTHWSDGGREPEYRRIVVRSSGAAIIIIQRFMSDIDMTAEEFSKRMVQGLLGSAEDSGTGRSVHVQSFLAGTLQDGVETRYYDSLHGVRVWLLTRTFRVEAANSVTLLFTQAEEEAWTVAAPGFDLITRSLVLK